MGQGLDKFKAEVEAATNGDDPGKRLSQFAVGDTTEMIDPGAAGANVGTVTDVAAFRASYPRWPLCPRLSCLILLTRRTNSRFRMNIWPGGGAEGEVRSRDAGLELVSGATPAVDPENRFGPPIWLVYACAPSAPIWIETIAPWAPTPIAWGEVYSALQMGAIDAAEAQPTAIKGAKLYEVIKNVTKPGHIQLVTALVVSARLGIRFRRKTRKSCVIWRWRIVVLPFLS